MDLSLASARTVALRRLAFTCHWLTACAGTPRPWRIVAPGAALLALAMAVGETRAQCARCGQSAAGPPASLWPPVYDAGPQRAERSWRKQARSGREAATTVAGGAHTVCARIRDEEAQRPMNFGLKEGQTLEETDPQGSTRRVRVLPAPF